MNYKEAWNELNQRLIKAKEEVIKMTDAREDLDNAYFRLLGKGNGINTAIQYMEEVEGCIDDDEGVKCIQNT